MTAPPHVDPMDLITRRLPGGGGVLPPADLTPTPVASVLDARAPLRVLPFVVGRLDEHETSIPEGERGSRKRQRLKTYRNAVECASRTGTITFGSWEREQTGRIKTSGPCLQNVANDLRRLFLPPEGCVFIDLDYGSLHVWVAALRSGDPKLLTALERGAPYQRWADKILPMVEDPKAARRAIKVSVLALLNGGTAETVARNLRDLLDKDEDLAARLGERILVSWLATHRVLFDYSMDVRATWEDDQQGRFWVEGLQGIPGEFIDTETKGDRGWKTLLSAHWTVPEAQALDLVIERLPAVLDPLGGAFHVPMYDGLLVSVPEQYAEVAQERLVALMEWAATQVGLAPVPVKAKVMMTWGG
jgi:hypothetical protein